MGEFHNADSRPVSSTVVPEIAYTRARRFVTRVYDTQKRPDGELDEMLAMLGLTGAPPATRAGGIPAPRDPQRGHPGRRDAR